MSRQDYEPLLRGGQGRSDRELALNAAVVFAIIVLCGIIATVCILMFGCSDKETVREVQAEPGVFTSADGYTTVLPYSGYTAVGRDGTVLSAANADCCGSGITITQTQGDGDGSQTATIDQSTSELAASYYGLQSAIDGQAIETEERMEREIAVRARDGMTFEPSQIEAMDGQGNWWFGEAGTHIISNKTPIYLENAFGDVLVGGMSRMGNTGNTLSLTHIPADGGPNEKVVMKKTDWIERAVWETSAGREAFAQ